jgi:cell wall-associated NlpC family hydrolase
MGELITRNGFHRVTGNPQPGDVLVMHIRAAGSRPNHAAVYVGEGNILHQTTGDVSGLAPWGGMWEHSTAMILRHESRMPAPPPPPAGTDLSETMGTKLSPP